MTVLKADDYESDDISRMMLGQTLKALAEQLAQIIIIELGQSSWTALSE